ncbi:MAG: flagellar export chaperone FlgN [Bdellovibrionota bacterium]
MALNYQTYRDLLDNINKQLTLYEEYIKAQNDEKESLKKADIKKVKENTALRSNILEYIHLHKNKLSDILTKEGESKILKLVNKKASAEQKSILIPKIRRLRELVKNTQGKAREYSELLDFSSNLVNGSLSILWSATQGIFKSYGRDRNIHEAYHPSLINKERKL